MAKSSDYKIISYYSTREPHLEKFKVIHGGTTQSTYTELAKAEEAVKNLRSDPWFYDRGYTRADRCK
jgi:hypothetical protein